MILVCINADHCTGFTAFYEILAMRYLQGLYGNFNWVVFNWVALELYVFGKEN